MYNRSLDLLAIALAKVKAGRVTEAAHFLSEAAADGSASVAINTILAANKKKKTKAKKKAKAGFDWPFTATANEEELCDLTEDPMLVDLDLQDDMLAEMSGMEEDEDMMEFAQEDCVELSSDDEEEDDDADEEEAEEGKASAALAQARSLQAKAAAAYKAARAKVQKAELMMQDLEPEAVGEDERVVPQVDEVTPEKLGANKTTASRLARALRNVQAANRK